MIKQAKEKISSSLKITKNKTTVHCNSILSPYLILLGIPPPNKSEFQFNT